MWDPTRRMLQIHQANDNFMEFLTQWRTCQENPQNDPLASTTFRHYTCNNPIGCLDSFSNDSIYGFYVTKYNLYQPNSSHSYGSVFDRILI